MAISIEDTLANQKELIQTDNPEADLAPGSVLNELLLKPAAVLQNPIKNSIADLSIGASFQSALASPTDTYNPLIDNSASNYLIERNQGRKSIGKVKIYVSASSTYLIKAGDVFTQPSLKLNYLASVNVKAVPNGAVGTEEVNLLLEGARYYFIVPLEAENAGSEYQLTDQTVLSPVQPIKKFVEAKAYGNFTSGQAVETDKELISRLKTGLTQTLLSKDGINSRLSAAYPGFRGVSLTGANDPELTRAKKNIFGISTLGMVDVYTRTSLGVETKSVIKQGTYNSTSGKWLIQLDNTDYGGCYRICSIVPYGYNKSGTLVFTEVPSYSTVNFEKTNLITNIQEARFTRYQTAEVEVEDPSVESFDGTFELLITHQPYINEIQDQFLSDNGQIACADYLIKAALPCYLTISLRIHRKDKQADFPIDKLKQDIFNYVNTLGFGDKLYVSEIVRICYNYGVKHVELPITITGIILANDSSRISISGSDVVEIPSIPALGISSKTTIFVVDYFAYVNDNRLASSIDIAVY